MAALVVAGIEETLYYYAFPREHRGSLRTNNPLERLLREVRRRTMRWERFPMANQRRCWPQHGCAMWPAQNGARVATWR